jgi:hypothetical protein
VTFKILEEALETMFQSVEGQAWELLARRPIYGLDTADYLHDHEEDLVHTAIFPCRGRLIGTKQELDRNQFVKFGYFGRHFFKSGRYPNVVAIATPTARTSLATS